MNQIVRLINNSILIEFDKGSFDFWCVYLKRPDMPRYAPKDIEYFSFLKYKSAIYGNTKVYSDFIKIYHKTDSEINPNTLELISKISENYATDSLEMEIWLTVIYAGMVAEENKERAILKKRVKRLGIHQLLIEGFTPDEAASWSKGKTWKELDKEMWKRGF